LGVEPLALGLDHLLGRDVGEAPRAPVRCEGLTG
jgi:hypothetical protein